ncbi:MAG: tRNA (adenosine(37)-N6)-threonylcarbamoyltransferase complex transferase subunit TsaD [Chloroflexia bacterium]|nr:tRNA (adenosine(37)-N6)-threonylcarbamoyltransferase complex transferase subunit TsaD [Chloroflexia bacterium]
MNILAIETSCDETSASVVHEGRWVRSNVIASQTDLHARYGGVVPELASRQHITAIIPVVQEALEIAGMTRDDIDAIAVTEGPGLAGALLVGVNFAKTLAFAWRKPLVPVNHLEGHVYSNWLIPPGEAAGDPPALPALCLIVSGGHTELLLLQKHGVYEILGRTRDDAAGEAFDKGARLLGLSYPGGPSIQKAAEGARPLGDLPRAWLGDSYDFSFSGLKTALLRACEPYQKMKGPPRRQPANRPQAPRELFPEHKPPEYVPNMPVNQLAASYQEAIVDVLVQKTARAAADQHVASVMVAGGVAANALLRRRLAHNVKVPVHVPDLQFCTDNAAMIAAAAYQAVRRGAAAGLDMDVSPQLPLDSLPGVRVIDRTHAAR